MSKSGDYDGTCPCSDPRCDWSRKARAGTLAQIRARRAELLEVQRGIPVEMFWHLFDDGAEFGPDKPEPPAIEFTRLQSGDFSTHIDGRGFGTIRGEVFDAIKKLGREEAKDE